ncbi:MAG: NBR1-Ig-like domain-containing protein, partial [Candidatus Taylorbacteria bacterium]|nr:NBR1-Ig-like domain-containing protein [Candidatus Taylorbacteria bacterium]
MTKHKLGHYFLTLILLGSLFFFLNTTSVLSQANNPKTTVTYPNGGEVWARNSVQTITWRTTGVVANVSIQLVKGPYIYRSIIKSTPNTGSYQWIIPTTIPEGTDYKIRVKGTGTAYLALDKSDNFFSIMGTVPGSILTPTPISMPTVSGNNSQFIAQTIPSTMNAGQNYTVYLTFKNTGTTTWTKFNTSSNSFGYNLGSQNFQDNNTWSLNRVSLPSNSVLPGSQETFVFNVKAPSTAGIHNFQWRMVQEMKEWFGDYSPNVAVSVVSATSTPSPTPTPTACTSPTATAPTASLTCNSVQGLQAVVNGSDVTLSWQPATCTKTVSMYVVYRSLNSGFIPFPTDFNVTYSSIDPRRNSIAQANSLIFTDKDLFSNSYYYRVGAEYTDGTVDLISSEIKAVVTTSPFQPPNTTVTANLMSSGTGNFCSSQYNFTLNDPDGINYYFFTVNEGSAGFGTNAPDPVPSCPTQTTSSPAYFLPIHFPLKVAIRDCKNPTTTYFLQVPLPNVTPTPIATNNAQFLSQSVPNSMTASQKYSVSVKMKNTGTSNWTYPGLFRLGSQNPQDNLTWGLGRVQLSSTSNETIAPGASKSFNFVVTAPITAGSYNFQWRMVQDGVAWFGDYSPNVAVNVSITPTPTPPIAGYPVCGQIVKNVPGNYSTIQAAIDAANPGDTVRVAAGTYYETLEVKSGICLEGAGIDQTNIIGGSSYYRLVNSGVYQLGITQVAIFRASYVTIKNITVKNSGASNTEGGGIRVLSSNNILVESCR